MDAPLLHKTWTGSAIVGEAEWAGRILASIILIKGAPFHPAEMGCLSWFTLNSTITNPSGDTCL